MSFKQEIRNTLIIEEMDFKMVKNIEQYKGISMNAK